MARHRAGSRRLEGHYAGWIHSINQSTIWSGIFVLLRTSTTVLRSTTVVLTSAVVIAGTVVVRFSNVL
jgi:hypothetical protein